MVYRHKDPSCVKVSSLAPSIPCGVLESIPTSNRSLGEESSSYEILFPTLDKFCENLLQKILEDLLDIKESLISSKISCMYITP